MTLGSDSIRSILCMSPCTQACVGRRRDNQLAAAAPVAFLTLLPSGLIFRGTVVTEVGALGGGLVSLCVHGQQRTWG